MQVIRGSEKETAKFYLLFTFYLTYQNKRSVFLFFSISVRKQHFSISTHRSIFYSQNSKKQTIIEYK